jgi:hypothetical protein
MESTHPLPSDSARLTGVVHGVRDRWRLKRALRGASIVVAAAFVLLAGSAFVLDKLHYGHTALLIARVIVLFIVAALAVVYVVVPLLPARRPSDRRVALYLEEHAPSLDAAVLTAVELQELEAAREKDESVRARRPVSNTLLSHLTRTALERVHTIDDGRHVDERELNVSAGILAGIAGVALLITVLGPSTLRHGMGLMLVPWDHERTAEAYAISAEPGNATIARGGDLLIAARLRGFQSDEVDLLVRQKDSTTWQRLTMALDSTGKFAGRYTFRLFDIVAPMDYVIESNGVRSPAYHIDVADVPYTKKLGLEYRFPSYTGMAPEAVDEGGDIAAVKGTQVRVRVTTTVPARGGRLIVERGERNDTVPLTPQTDGTLGGSLRVDAAGFYKVELSAQDGRIFPGSLDYTIDALPDRPPTIMFSKPGRDEKVLNVDEVYAEVQADDDYGVQKLELVYSVNGGPEKTESLYNATRRTPQMTAGHTFSLEDFKLQPGDVVSYYARATDNDAVSGAKTATTDIYFLQVRPFDQEYKQDQGGGGGGGGNDDTGQLSEQERQIIAGTFNTLRDKASKQAKDLQEDLSTLRVSQQKLRGQTEELARRIVDRGVAARDSNFAQIAEILKKAAPIMDTAEKQLADGNAQTALSPEQRALQQLQHAEAVFRKVRVSMGGQGGGGGASSQRAQDLADLFELNRDKLRNQYESVQRGREQQQEADQQVDETADKLKRLAARLQQENERAQRKADSLGQRMGASGSSGGAAQRQMAQEAEEAARQLERLAREKAEQQRQQEGGGSQQSNSSSSSASSSRSSQSSSNSNSQAQQREQRALEDAARRLREAADAMRRSASGSSSSQQAAADAAAAQQRIEEARRLLEQQRSGRLERDVQDVLESAKELGRKEQQVAGDVGKLWDNSNAQGRAQQLQSLTEQKGQMADQLRDLKSRMDKLSLDSRRENKDAATGLAEASKTLRDHKTEEKIRASQGAMRYAGPEYTKNLESMIGNDLTDLQQRLEQVATAARNGAGKSNDQASPSQALDRARDLVRGMQSLDERMRNGQAGKDRGQQANGQQSQAGRNGQPNGQQNGQANGKQGQNGQQGQSGQARGGQQGPNGQQNGQGQPGQPGGTAQGGMRGGANGGGRPGAETSAAAGPPEGQSLGQYGREMRERLSDAQALRRDLQREGVDTRELDRAIAGMQALSNDRILADERSAADLRAQTLENLKAFEFALRKKLGESDENRVLLGRTGDVPAAFKQYVEEYYKSLAKKP